jgi:hypothetical protein
VSERESHARSIIDANRYMTLATADEYGRPWASPVWFATYGYREFLWVSRPEARHSRNISVLPEVSIVIFDSHAALGPQAVYIEGVAHEQAGDAVERGVEGYSAASLAQGLPEWTYADVSAPAPLRLYRARASEVFVLEAGDRRARVSPSRPA